MAREVVARDWPTDPRPVQIGFGETERLAGIVAGERR
jgi:hypothetical protein